jgi:hypothetical protein
MSASALILAGRKSVPGLELCGRFANTAPIDSSLFRLIAWFVSHDELRRVIKRLQNRIA